jgi:hypothetical protein
MIRTREEREAAVRRGAVIVRKERFDLAGFGVSKVCTLSQLLDEDWLAFSARRMAMEFNHVFDCEKSATFRAGCFSVVWADGDNRWDIGVLVAQTISRPEQQ